LEEESSFSFLHSPDFDRGIVMREDPEQQLPAVEMLRIEEELAHLNEEDFVWEMNVEVLICNWKLSS